MTVAPDQTRLRGEDAKKLTQIIAEHADEFEDRDPRQAAGISTL
jgi:hypothetical protein